MKLQFSKRALACCIAAALSGNALAQGTIDEVVVTATKRAENIQDVPVSVAAVSSADMEKMGLVDMEDLSLLVPNFEINSGSILPNLYIRGLGGGTTHSIEQSAGRFVDEVYISRAAINFHPFMDVAGVEVLRGPQGTLFGKNTAAGALIIRTADPTDELEYGFDVSTSQYSTTGGQTEVSGFVSGSLSDNVSARFTALYRDWDSFYINTYEGLGPDGTQREDYGARLKVRWDVSDQMVVNFKAEHMEYDSLGADTAEISGLAGGPATWQGLAINSGVAPDLAATVNAELDWRIHVNCGEAQSAPGPQAGQSIGSFCPSRDQETDNLTVDLEYDFDAGTFKSITAYQTYDYDHRFHGADQGAVNLFRARRQESYDGFTQEFRFTSAENDTLDYIVGLYYEDSDLAREQTSDLNLPGGPFFREEEPWTQDTQTLAIFGQARWYVSDRVTALIGGRFSSEDKDFEFRRFFTEYGGDTFLFDDILPRAESRTEDKFTPSLTVQFDATDNIMLFGTYAQGHKTGGFSDRVDTQDGPIEFDEETVDSFEFGMKSTLLDGSLNLNVTLFTMDVEGLQLATQVEGTVADFAVGNAADSSVDGLELEWFWALTDELTFGGNFAYTDATYDEFVGAGSCPAEFLNASGVCDLAGQPLQFAPETKGSLFFDYDLIDAFGGWDLGMRADVTHTGSQFTDISYFPGTFQPSVETYNAGVRLVAPSDNITIQLLGKNLTDERILAWGVPSGPNFLAAMAPPREVQLRVGLRF
ncbi:MAG: TonB-dependent receptor [Pseudomonadota bacterium]